MTFKSGANQATLNQLVREVKALNSDFLGQDISSKAMGNVEAIYYLFLMHACIEVSQCVYSPGAAYRFYQSQCEQLSVQRRGKEPLARTQRRRRERVSRVCNSYPSVVVYVCLTSCTVCSLGMLLCAHAHLLLHGNSFMAIYMLFPLLRNSKNGLLPCRRWSSHQKNNVTGGRLSWILG